MFKNLPNRVVAEAPPLWMSEVEMTWAEFEEEDEEEHEDEDEDEEEDAEDLASLRFFPKVVSKNNLVLSMFRNEWLFSYRTLRFLGHGLFRCRRCWGCFYVKIML